MEEKPKEAEPRRFPTREILIAALSIGIGLPAGYYQNILPKHDEPIKVDRQHPALLDWRVTQLEDNYKSIDIKLNKILLRLKRRPAEEDDGLVSEKNLQSESEKQGG